jgi:hypothetical protein
MRQANAILGLIGLFLATPNAARGQITPKLEFEVASVRAAAPQSAGSSYRSWRLLREVKSCIHTRATPEPVTFVKNWITLGSAGSSRNGRTMIVRPGNPARSRAALPNGFISKEDDPQSLP